ncbi:SusC/RagA family TonB-linked outer membrane protein [Adhaeribacter rhizoryzae]|uniref:TonB-dependent receptor n=1 Tax=Adhaeribacter rhizoryzae TaxID=2607907 RepID=A0A5M6DJK4_9BACT|nr:TonB-dependent receptor [Adhaeribacter rhizoryzae]KAA5546420.1 TonB-dependent receptor [Adhaeribacter rhizoryzae]
MKKRIHCPHYLFWVLPLLPLQPNLAQAESNVAIAGTYVSPEASKAAVAFLNKKSNNTSFHNKLAEVTIQGKVTGEANDALPGVTVQVKGTTTGTSTGVDGSYSLTVPDGNATLVFSYVGYTTQEVAINNRTTLNVTLRPDAKALEEVVVVGYGTQKKGDVTVAVASVAGEAIAERGTVNPLQAVQGQVAGVDISAGSGRAGTNYNIQIRGQNSLAGGSPLYVVDGVIVPDINFLNPQDIAKMDVLKDAASTAIYGSRGSNGVVIVTTKQGNLVKGGATISYDGYTGIRQNVRMPNFMEGPEWWEFRQNSYIVPELIAGNNPTDIGAAGSSNPEVARRIAENDYTNWRDLVMQTGVQNNHWLTVSGTSSNNMQYVLGAGYQNEKGNLINEYFDRYNFKASVDHKISDRWAAGAAFNFAISEIERGSDLAVTNAFRMAPIFKPYDDAGNLVFRPGQIPIPGTTNVTSMTSSVNPLLDNENSDNNTRRSFGVGNLYLQYSPLEGVSFRSTFSPRVTFERNGRFWGSQTESRGGLQPAAELRNNEAFSYILDNIVTVNKAYKEHSFTFTGLHSIQQERYESNFSRVTNLPFNSSFYNLGTASSRERIESDFSKISLISYMGRINYAFRDRYLVTLATRWDGSSKLSPGNKWSSFPSAAIAWRLSEEGFMDGFDFLTDLKVRLSAGVAGNNNNISAYGTQMNLSSPTFYDFGGTLGLGYTPNRLPNPGLTWERTREYDLGLDYALFMGRVSGSVDVYDKLSQGVIMDRDVAMENGWVSIKDNVGSVSNKGVELSLRTVNIATDNFEWSTTFNFARNKNAIVELLDKKEDLPGNSWFIGEPINVNYTYIFDGIWQENQADQALIYKQIPGMARVKDTDGNGVLNNADRAIIGQRDPKWTGGFSTSVTYRGFDFSASLFARQGHQVLSTFHQEFTNLADRGRTKLDVDYYMPANNITPARVSNTYPMPGRPGDYWSLVGYYKDASFVKVQNISLGYSLPASLLERVKIKSVRLYSNVLNPFVFSDYDGFDPEYAAESLNNTGVSTVTYQFGVNLKF